MESASVKYHSKLYNNSGILKEELARSTCMVSAYSSQLTCSSSFASSNLTSAISCGGLEAVVATTGLVLAVGRVAAAVAAVAACAAGVAISGVTEGLGFAAVAGLGLGLSGDGGGLLLGFGAAVGREIEELSGLVTFGDAFLGLPSSSDDDSNPSGSGSVSIARGL